MVTSGFICYNGDYLHTDQHFLGIDNRALLYGDTVTEELHAYATEPQFLKAHLRKLISAMELLSMEIPGDFHHDRLTTYISKLLTKNKYFGGAAVRITVFRNASQHDIPFRHDVSYVLDCRKLEHNFYELNSRGILIEVYQDMVQKIHPLSSIRSADPFLFLKARIHCERNKLDDCILLNERKKITETVYSNIFLVKDNAVFTPSVQEGCIPGVMRDIMIDICNRNGFRTNDQCSLSPEVMHEADEVFLTDAVNGLRWVGAYNQRRYYKNIIRHLNVKLNQYAFEKRAGV